MTRERTGLGTFAGVYRPVVLTVLGAMLYLREGWLVGNAGLLGALGVIGAAYAITGATALSVSTVATNVRVQAGGAFAIIARALGLEAGGAIGIPLFVAQAASSAMYLYAFTEGWAVIFPDHAPGAVVAVAFVVVGGVAWGSAALAAGAQAFMLVVVALAMTAIALGAAVHPTIAPTWTGSLPDATLSECFAIFFPAATGIMVGVGMSGDLDDPRRSIPRGTIAAWGTTLVAYVLAAFWYASIATPEVLIADKTVVISRSLWGPVVLFGLLSSTSMAALSTLVASPRLLAAMAGHGVVPGARWLVTSEAAPQPRAATLVTLALTGLFLLTGSLDAIAPIVTAAFLGTYLAINVVVMLEQRLAMISWRPSMKVSRWVAPLGALACLVALLVSSPVAGLAELAAMGGLYLWLQRRQLDTPWETVRSGFAVNLAAWAARQTRGLERSERAWKPDLLLLAGSTDELHTLLPVATAVAHHHGSVKLLGLGDPGSLREPFEQASRRLEAAGVYCTATTLEAPLAQGGLLALEALRGALFPPNMVVVDGTHPDQPALQELLDRCRSLKTGLMVVLPGPPDRAVSSRDVTVWLSDRSPTWSLKLHMANLDLLVLVGWLVTRHTGGRLTLATVTRDEEQRGPAAQFLARLVDLGRLPDETLTQVHVGGLDAALDGPHDSGLHLFGLGVKVESARLADLRDRVGAPIWFLLDSGAESLLA